MSENELSKEKLEAIMEVKKEWLAEAKALAENPPVEDDYISFGFDGHHGTDITEELTKKYIQRILQIKGKFPKDGDTHGNG